MATEPFVLVGYDGSKESEDALRWAAGEAGLRRLPLKVCHAWRWPYPAGYIDHKGTMIARRMGERILDHGVKLARRMAPTVDVGKRLMDGPAHAALTREGHHAEMIVVGSYGQGGPPLGSTALRLPACAPRPVVVVRGTATGFAEVVAGVDGSAGGAAALAFAFEQAALRGWRLRAVHGCWEPSAVTENDLALFHEDDRLRRVCHARLERALEPWWDKYPQVDARTSLVLKAPREALFEAAASAGLMVVGGRSAGGPDPLPLGATSGALVRRAPCTVAIVQPG